MAYEVKTPMPAKVLEIKVAVGDVVTSDTEIAMVESMKMEMPVLAEEDGTISAISVAEGDTIAKDAVIVTID